MHKLSSKRYPLLKQMAEQSELERDGQTAGRPPAEAVTEFRTNRGGV